MTDNLFPRFSASEYTRRPGAIREAMKKDNVDALLVSGGRGSSEVNYFSTVSLSHRAGCCFRATVTRRFSFTSSITSPAPRRSR